MNWNKKKKIVDDINGTIKVKEKLNHNTYSRANSGRREDIGDMFFRSSWEANIARYLDLLVERGTIQHWWYEPVRFSFSEDMVVNGKKVRGIKCGTVSYLPDFLILNNDDTFTFIEVKGWMDPKSKTKLKRMVKYHPEIIVEVIGQKEYDEITKKESRNIKGWEYRYR